MIFMRCHYERSEAESKNPAIFRQVLNLDRAGALAGSLAALGMTNGVATTV